MLIRVDIVCVLCGVAGPAEGREFMMGEGIRRIVRLRRECRDHKGEHREDSPRFHEHINLDCKINAMLLWSRRRLMARSRTLLKRKKRRVGKYAYDSAISSPPSVALLAGTVPPSDPGTAATVVPPPPLPKPESKMRANVERALLLKLGGKTYKEAAVELGISYGYLRQCLYHAGKEGWLQSSDVEDTLQFSTVHKIVRNINTALDGEDADKRQEMTIEAAKGLGLFKKHEVVSNDQAPAMMALSVKIEQPSGDEPELAVGAVGGTPAYVDAE